MTQKSDPVIEKMHARKLQSRKLGSLGFAFTSPVRHLHCSPASCHLRWDTIRLLKLNTLWPKPNSRFSLSNLLLSHLPNLSTWKALCVPLLGLKFSSFFLSHPTHIQSIKNPTGSAFECIQNPYFAAASLLPP